MKYLSKRFISVLISFAFFAASLVAYANFIKPTYAIIKTEQGKLEVATQRNKEYSEVFGKLKSVLDNLKRSPDLQNRISMALPLDPNAADSMNQITAIAAANGLAVGSVDIVEAPVISTTASKAGAVSLVKGIGVLRNTVRVSGTYAQLHAFLQGVESSVRIASIRSVKMDRASVASIDAINANVEIETYYQTN